MKIHLPGFLLPRPSLRFIHIWRRNRLVWTKLAIPSMLGNLADPMLYMLGLGYGLGAMLPHVVGMPYIAFLAAGTVCSSTMMSASFESMYSSFSRMHVQHTWDAILNAPVMLDDVVAGEAVWAASKAFLSGAAVLIVATALGLVASPLALWVLPVVFITGLAFAGLGLIMTSLSPSYDFFMYYFTLAITPMMLASGVFFPLSQLPAWLQAAAQALPLTHAVALVRPLMTGSVPQSAGVHVLVLVSYALASCYVALALARRRLLK
ncbi:MAG: Transport permease protein [Betaproteobacteria bacterium]|nr:Transport permease protein [Betaproteobacteria bacterium]MEA3153714.1 lipooligosaccharide transport system permease protein [Betaproteobacteria bacterium]